MAQRRRARLAIDVHVGEVRALVAADDRVVSSTVPIGAGAMVVARG